MKERPILFNSEMVRAILDGRKTQTRRVYKGTPPTFYPSAAGGCWGIPMGEREKCPFGKPGDRLWVRETWGESGFKRFEYRAFPADGTDFRCVSRWRPSIHMPRWASRITLEVTNVRVERLQDISEEDAIAEGIRLRDHSTLKYWSYHSNDWTADAIHGFASLWNSINAKRGYSWGDNPWVWVIEFKRVDK